jgi:hypothetical protein
VSDALPDDPETLKAMLLTERCESERLRQIIKELQRHRFGRRAETLPEDQMLLGLEDVEQAAAYGETAQDVSALEGREVRARIRYALSRWESLTRFIDDGRIELDNNVVERSIRPITLNRKMRAPSLQSV